MRISSGAPTFALILALPCAAWYEAAAQNMTPGVNCADGTDFAASEADTGELPRCIAATPPVIPEEKPNA